MSRYSVTLSKLLSFGSSYSAGFIRQDPIIVTACRSIRDIDEDASRLISETFLAPSDHNNNLLQYLPSTSLPISKSVIYDISPKGKTLSITHNKDGNPVIELNTLSYDIKIDASSYHGKVLGDTWFGGVSWSYDERYVAYVARNKEPTKPTTTFETNAITDSNTNSKDNTGKVKVDHVSKFEYKEDWGERFEGVSSTVIAILDTTTGRITTLNHDVDTTIGCPVFATNSYQLLYTYWPALPRRLGVVYCHQRPCSLYLTDISAILSLHSFTSVYAYNTQSTETSLQGLRATPLTAGLIIARLGRFTPDGTHLVVLGRRTQPTTHVYCYELYKLDLTNLSSLPTPELIVPIVDIPATKHAFPGTCLYVIYTRGIIIVLRYMNIKSTYVYIS